MFVCLLAPLAFGQSATATLTMTITIVPTITLDTELLDKTFPDIQTRCWEAIADVDGDGPYWAYKVRPCGPEWPPATTTWLEGPDPWPTPELKLPPPEEIPPLSPPPPPPTETPTTEG